jgi:hypothetical protein
MMIKQLLIGSWPFVFCASAAGALVSKNRISQPGLFFQTAIEEAMETATEAEIEAVKCRQGTEDGRRTTEETKGVTWGG